MRAVTAESALTMTAKEIVNALIFSGLSLGQIAIETKIQKSQLSRISHGQTCSEATFRTLARFAIQKRVPPLS